MHSIWISEVKRFRSERVEETKGNGKDAAQRSVIENEIRKTRFVVEISVMKSLPFPRRPKATKKYKLKMHLRVNLHHFSSFEWVFLAFVPFLSTHYSIFNFSCVIIANDNCEVSSLIIHDWTIESQRQHKWEKVQRRHASLSSIHTSREVCNRMFPISLISHSALCLHRAIPRFRWRHHHLRFWLRQNQNRTKKWNE